MSTPEIDMSKATRVAYADTTHLGRDRWSELSVYYLPEAVDGGKRWVALSVGMSKRPGEKPITDKLVTFGLDQALKLFDDSPIGVKVKAEARDWEQHHFGGDDVAGHPIARQAAKFDGSSDEEALAYLFGDKLPRSRQAAALGLNESTLRQQLGGKGVRVALLSVLPFIDREAFLASITEADNAA